MSKKIKSFLGLKKGQKFIVTKTGGGHNYPLNTVLTLSRDIVNIGSPHNIATEYPQGNTIAPSCIELIASTIVEMKKQLKDIETEFKKEKSILQSKINFCEENGVEEFDENLFKVIEALKALDSKSSNVEKAKVIASLINS